MEHVDFLLIGGGLASATAAETLRTADAKGSIVILSAEKLPPYHHPPLSKGFLTGGENEASLFIHPEEFYRERDIDLRLDTPALSVDSTRRIVTTKDREIGYGQLLIATGGVPEPLSVPGADLPGIFNLHYKADSDAIRRAAKNAKRAVVVGGSFLGVEIAMSLMKLGLEVSIVEQGPVLLPFLESEELSEYFLRYVEKLGLSVVPNDEVAALNGGNKVREVETAAGRRLPCDLVAVAIGLSPASDFLAGSGIALEDGYILVDERLRTNIPNVYAAGDVTLFYDPIFARPRHIEHWDNAIKQGRLAAYNMLGRRLRYDEVSYFFCDIGDISFAMLGAPEEAGERIGRGSLDARSYALFYLKDNLLRGLFTTGRPAAETRGAEGFIRYRTNLGAVKERLPDPAFALDEIPAQTALILQGGGALGAFECGAVKALEEEEIFPDIVAGISIGAFNGAIIAANPGHATKALEGFWNELSVATPKIPLLPAQFAGGEKAAMAMSILTFGVPKFFRPRWMPPYDDLAVCPWKWTSFYDPTPAKALLAKYVDFDKLNPSNPVRLLIGAVNVITAELEVFDSYVDKLTPDHILASGSLPPGFPWTVIDGKPYWDGGIVSNSPLDLMMGRCGPGGKRTVIVDLYLGQRALPSNMMEVLARRDEIVYSERVRSDLQYREMVNAYRGLIEDILERLDPEEAEKIRQRPRYIQLMSDGASATTIRIERPAHEAEQASRDYDFSDIAIRGYIAEGYEAAKRALAAAEAGGKLDLSHGRPSPGSPRAAKSSSR